MKKITGIIFAIILSVTLTTVCFARLESQNVEISFKVGDSTLIVNSQELTVETPYVVGEGVTLVPVRVITEAFGAKVDWDGTDKMVTLSTEDKIIRLWIGKDTASVDGKEVTLLSAPQLTNSVTMVPLRFISESFGADVSYDDETRAILVTMKKMPYVNYGMYFYETQDGTFSAPIPNELNPVFDETDSGIYSFASPQSTVYSVNTVIYNSKTSTDIRKCASSDRTSQLEAIEKTNITVSEVKNTQINGVDVYYYNLTEEFAYERRIVVTKAFFNHGNKSYLYLSYIAGADYNVENEEISNSISNDGYRITIPSAFSDSGIYKSTTKPRADSSKSISFNIFKATKDADIKEYLRYNQIAHPTNGYLSYAENEVYSSEYSFMGKKVTAYEATVIGKENGNKNIIFKYDDYIINANFVTDLKDDDIQYILENVYFDFESIDAPVFENALNYSNMQKNNISVKTSDITFNVPDCFEITYSSDKRFVVAKDTESGLTLICTVNAKTIDNDDKEDGIVFTATQGAVEGKVKKRTANSVLSDTFDNLEALSWDDLMTPTRVSDSDEICKTGTDTFKLKRSDVGLTYFMNNYHVRIDDKVFDEKQRLHSFTFIYPAECHDFETMMKISSIMRSVKSK